MGRRSRFAAVLATLTVAVAIVVASTAVQELDAPPAGRVPSPKPTLSGATRTPAPPTLGFPGLAVGVTANALDDDPVRQASRVRALGMGWMREELRWSEFEPRRGAFETARFDRVVLAAAARGIRILPVLTTTPPWLSDELFALPPDLRRWQRFVRLVMLRYAPGGAFWRGRPGLDRRLAPRVWEVWNEPYLDIFSPPAPDPRAYAALLRATARTGRAVDAKARFLVAAETVYTARGGSRRDWLEDVLATGPATVAAIDALSVHPYTPGSPLSREGDRDAQFDRLDDLQATLVSAGAGPRPLWLTELGWTTCTARPPCLTPGEQRDFYEQALGRIVTKYRRSVEAVFAYRLTDIRAEGPASFQSGFGLYDLRGHKKPAWSVLQRAARGAQ